MLANRVRMGVSGDSWLDGLVGPKKLIAGDMSAGFFGEVPVELLWDGVEIAEVTGVYERNNQYQDEPWLKFAIDGNVIYKSKKPYHNSINYNMLLEAEVIDGRRTISKDGIDYKVRVLRGGSSEENSKYSEWNRLMLPIHKDVETQNWRNPQYIDTPVPDWGIHYTDEDLLTFESNGSHQITMELDNDRAVTRGGWSVDFYMTRLKNDRFKPRGWSPVLEVIK